MKEKETDKQAAVTNEKLKALQTAMDKIEKSYGKGSIMRMGEQNIEAIPVIPTGSIGLNAALGVGGYPRGRVIEIYGPESSGKTTLAIHAIAEAQKAGGIAAFIDAEHAFDRFYAEKLGVKTDDILMSQPDNGEQALEITEQLIRSAAIDIIVIDSVAALTPKAEIEGDMGDSKMGLQARLMSQALRKLTSAISKTNTTCIFINQLRDKIGVMFGSPETTTGGNALKFYASVRLDIRKIGQLKDGDEAIGSQTRVKVVKNKVAPPFRKAEFDIIYGQGISRVGEIVDLGSDLNIIKKSGSWYSYNETKLGQGREAAKECIKDNPELSEELEGLIFEALKTKKIKNTVMKEDEVSIEYNDDEAVKYIINSIPQELKEKVSKEIIFDFLDVIYDFYDSKGVADENLEDEIDIDEEEMAQFIIKNAPKRLTKLYTEEEILFIVQGEIAYCDSIGLYED